MNGGKITAGGSFLFGFYFALGALTAITLWGVASLWISSYFFSAVFSRMFPPPTDSQAIVPTPIPQSLPPQIPSFDLGLTHDQTIIFWGIIIIVVLSTFLLVKRLFKK